jgi:hypothetical protein
MSTQTIPRALESPAEIEAGVIDEARARQRRHRLGGLLAASVAALAIGLIIGFGGGHGSTPNTPFALQSGLPASFVSSQSRAGATYRYRILVTHGVSAATLPVRRPIVIHRDLLNQRSELVAEVHPAPGVRMWLVLRKSLICGFTRNPGGGSGQCSPRLQPLMGPGETGTYPGGTSAVGFVTNAVKSVTVHLANGGTLVAPVKDNVYYVRLHDTHGGISGVTPNRATAAAHKAQPTPSAS